MGWFSGNSGWSEPVKGGLFGDSINPATGRPRRDDKELRALAKREDAKAKAAIEKTKKVAAARAARVEQKSKSWWN